MFDGRLIMSFNALNYPSHLFSDVYTHKLPCRAKMKPVFAIPPSSVVLPTDESGKFRDSTTSGFSDLLLSQANTVGIIGGASENSTLNFLKKLVQWSSKDGQDCLPFLLCSDPELNKELLTHERDSFRLLGRQNAISKLNHMSLVEKLRSKRVFLESSGARCIVMPCNISHSWHGEVSKECSAEFLHMGDCVARELKAAKLKPLEAGSPLRIGVLGTTATLTAGFYQEKLQNEGFEVVLPDKATMEHTIIPSIEALNRNDMEGARNLLRIALQVLLVRAVNTVILASDDMHDLLPHNDPLLKKCIDPIDALVRSTIKWGQASGKIT
ncbi:aspartate-glutamate racemase family [Euphorbia peplus]|nr:aspartate-glutamate racemase family [Euphorbia peplus]